jgi:hypothetical protein
LECNAVSAGEPGHKYHGTYFLDYVMTSDTDLAPMQNIGSLTAMVHRTRAVIEKQLPLLLESYNSFFDSYFSPSSRPERQWEQSNDPLPTNDQELDDEAQVKLGKQAPNCLGGMKQAFVRNQAGGVIYYTYNPGIRTALVTKGWLQLSYALHHEWLRDHVNDPHQLRELNRILHSGVMDDPSASLCEIFKEAHACPLSEVAPKLPEPAKFVSNAEVACPGETAPEGDDYDASMVCGFETSQIENGRVTRLKPFDIGASTTMTSYSRNGTSSTTYSEPCRLVGRTFDIPAVGSPPYQSYAGTATIVGKPAKFKIRWFDADHYHLSVTYDDERAETCMVRF